MHKKFIKTLLTFLLLLSLSGCVWLVVGGVGALGGYVISPDTIEGVSRMPQGELWDASGKVLSIMGTIEEKNRDAGEIKALIQGAKITVTLTPLNKSTTTVRVKARKAFLPKIALAQDVYIKILEYVDE